MLLANNAQGSIVQEHRKKENGAPGARKVQCEFDPLHTTATTHTQEILHQSVPRRKEIDASETSHRISACVFRTASVFVMQSPISQSRFSKR